MVMAIEAVMPSKVVSPGSVWATESAVRSADCVPTGGTTSAAELPGAGATEVPTTTAVPAATAARVRRRAAGEDQDADQYGQPN